MGQYWVPVNLDKHEVISPHKLGCGLKLWEQLANHPGTGTALLILCAAMPERRGGGDLTEDPVIGRWAGDRIALVGDYAEDGDLAAEHRASTIFGNSILYTEDGEGPRHEGAPVYTDITDLVAPVIERELGGRYEGTGWRNWVQG